MAVAGVNGFLLLSRSERIIIFVLISLFSLPLFLAESSFDLGTALQFYQNNKPYDEARKAHKRLQEGLARRHQEMHEIFTQYEYDLANGYMSFDDFESKRKAFLEETIILMEASKYNQEKYERFQTTYWKSRDFIMDEYRQEFEIKTLNKVLNIFQNPSLMLKDAVSSAKSSLTGFTVWDSGLTLAKYLEVSCANTSWIRGKRILDLSTGTGYVGIVAACLGGDVTVTDLPQMIPFTQKNIDANSKHLEGTGGKIRTQILRWGDEEGAKSIPKPDVILTSGVVYRAESVEPLVSTLVALSDENTVLVICNEDWSKDLSNSLFWNAFYTHATKYFKLSSIPHKGLLARGTSLRYGSENGVLLFRGNLK